MNSFCDSQSWVGWFRSGSWILQRITLDLHNHQEHTCSISSMITSLRGILGRGVLYLAGEKPNQPVKGTRNTSAPLLLCGTPQWNAVDPFRTTRNWNWNAECQEWRIGMQNTILKLTTQILNTILYTQYCTTIGDPTNSTSELGTDRSASMKRWHLPLCMCQLSAIIGRK
jgi:hypothetical protein